uniref:Palmitoyltransferase n=1 Tax=Mandrillus leucophaeus TaxID=9568 RepID=A0A2K5ZGE7_MANLE
MTLLMDATPQVKELYPLPLVPRPWVLSSLFAAFNVVLLVFFSGLFFAFPCRWLWAAPAWDRALTAAPSAVPHPLPTPGSAEQGPLTVHVVWVNHGAFRLQWCPQCCFHRPPRTYHCPWCNICVEDFDHHCKWVNNCIGHRNFRFFMLLVLSLCLYSGALLVTCLIFLVRTTHLPFSTDKAVAYPPTWGRRGRRRGQPRRAVSVSSADRTYKVKCRHLHGYNPFDQGCASNWYLAICAPLGPKYMAEAVQLQRVVGPDWTSVPNLHPPMSPSALNPPAPPTSGYLPTRKGSPRVW